MNYSGRSAMKKISTAYALMLGLALVASTQVAFAINEHPAPSSETATLPAAPQLHTAMRSLWHGHIVATRDYALAIYSGNNNDATKASDAAVANAKQIANAVASFYGEAAGNQMLKLLAGHWAGVKALTDATHADNKAEEKKAMDDLSSNVSAIAKFLSGANPNLPDKVVAGLLMMHVNDHQIQINQIMSNAPKVEQDKSWTEMQGHMDMIADELANGIAKQFPNKAK
jgi:hypothetical protein